ncbi:MAG: Hsp20/alpha crystallin family protein [Thermoflexales bacterium]|nr:Hsp20/alpha crystallin family protein [Thermoflexales bacterium]
MTRLIRTTFAPAPEMLSLRDIVNQMMENAVVSPSQWLGSLHGTNVDAPALDVLENENGYVVKAALPGWKPENVDVSIENGVVTLKGEVKDNEAAPQEGNRYHFREIRHNAFQRVLSLPTEIQSDKATAEFENGVLTLSVPKAEVVKPKTVKIAVK